MIRSSRAPNFLRHAPIFGLLLTAALSLFGCESDGEGPTGGETHFLRRCDAAAQTDACGSGLSCVCDVCTLPCSADTACSALPSARCAAPSTAQACGAFQNAGHCEVTCSGDGDCSKLSSLHRCQGGVCRAGTSTSCPHGDVQANEVLVIGDSFFAASHQITAYLEDLARSSGALSAGERYRDNSSLLSNTLALSGNGIEDQYAAGAAEAQVKVVIMDGGGADVLLGSCDTVSSDCPLLVNAANAAQKALSHMADDGVGHVFFAYYPDPVDATVRDKVDALRPLLQSACENSRTPCHWVDLRIAFAGHYADYVRSDGLNPTAAGSQASANQIWSAMQDQCVAQ